MKYRADLYSSGEKIEGHIIIDEHLFIWKPFIPNLARKLFGIDVFEIPLADLEGYQKKGNKLVIGIHGYNEFPRFHTKHSQEIIEAIQANNHQFRMYASNEITSEFNWRALIELGICILVVVGYILLKKMGVF